MSFNAIYVVMFDTEQKQSAKFTNEIREIRVREGTKARFEATFAGNPQPTFIWQVIQNKIPTLTTTELF